MNPTPAEKAADRIVDINGHNWIHGADVGPIAKNEFADICGHCGCPRYAHQLNVLEYPACCDLYRPA